MASVTKSESCSPVLEKYFVGNCNYCIEKQFLPECLKIAKVLPLFKKDDEILPFNYRPISLLSSLGKVFKQKQSLYPSTVWFQTKIFLRPCNCRNN